MNDETRKRMQQIFAEQQAKAAAKAAPKDRTGEPTPQPPAAKPQAAKLPEVKTYDNLKDIEEAADNGQTISLYNLAELVNKKDEPQQEFSTITSADLIGDYKKPFPFRQPTNFEQLTPKITSHVCTPQAADFSTLINPAEKQVATDAKNVIQWIDYSEKSFALIGEKTKSIKDNLAMLGGSYNGHLKCGKGWIFSKKRAEEVKAFLQSLK